MKFLSTVLMLVLFIAGINAQSFIADTKIPLKEVAVIEMPLQDNQELKELELAHRGPGVAPKFATVIPVDITPFTYGDWEELDNGTAVWRLRIHSSEAFSLNFGFTEYRMPSSGKLIFYSPNKKKVIGPFTYRDNETHGQLWTPIIEGEEVVLEVQIAAQEKSDLRLRLAFVNHDFLGFSTALSGSCNLDVICGADDGFAIVDEYRDIIQSAAVYAAGGTTICSGALINTTEDDCAPYFLTANHCMQGENPASVVVYWNYINSFCRTPNSGASGGAGDGVLTDFNTGSTRKASYGPSDFYLIELDDPVSSTANAFFAGWDSGADLPADTLIVIHHPGVDEKRISFEFDTPHLGDWGNGGAEVPDGDHVIIPDWDIGTTEGGSSGSPLFNKNKQIIGQLHGGGAACGNDEYDSFGWIHASWEGGGTPDTRLKDWLDPNNTGATNIDGRGQILCSFFVISEPRRLDLCAPADAVYTLNVSESFGSDVTLTLTDLPENAVATFAQNPVSPGGTTSLMISNTSNIAEGVHVFGINGTDGTNTATFDLILNVVNGAPTVAGLTPADGSMELPLNVLFGWMDLGEGLYYDFQLGTDVGLSNLLMDESGLSANSIHSILLETETTYYWSVRASNICGMGDWTDVATFSTGAIACGALVAEDLPITIDENDPSTITSVINYAGVGLISEVEIHNLAMTHSWVGDLSATLTAPSGMVINLFDRPGVPETEFGCDGSDAFLNFSDSATSTAADLESSCAGDIALAGDFQPIDPLNALANQEAGGDWILTISDAVGFDGGTLDGWELFICTAIPDIAAIFPSVETISACPTTTLTFNALVGTGFEGQVTLDFAGLPNDALIEYTPNEIEPGDNVMVTISNVAEGMYDLAITASDGTQNNTANIGVEILSTLPGASLLLPADGEVDAPTGMSFSWNAVTGASNYILTVSNDENFTDIFFTTSTTATDFNVTGLDFNTTYYWSVVAVDDCGEGNSSDVFSFVTMPNLVTTINPTDFNICQSDEAVVVIQPGVGFGNPSMVTMQATSSVQPTVTYSIDPTQVEPGISFTATISNFGSLSESSLDVVFTISDGVYSQEVRASVSFMPTPALPSLIEPVNGANVFSSMVSFDWITVAGATGYLFELATDEAFSNIVLSETVTASRLDVDDIPGALGLYYWRVTAINECGQATSAPVSFNYTVATHELNGRKVEVFPNPTSDKVYVSFSLPFEEDLLLELYDIRGRLLNNSIISRGEGSRLLEVSDYPDGIYILKISGDAGSLIERIVIDK